MGSLRTHLKLMMILFAFAALALACDDGGDDGGTDTASTADAATGDMGGGDMGVDLVAAGKLLYESGGAPTCESCHGASGSEETFPGATNLTTYTGDDATIADVIANGGTSMPPNPNFSAQEIDALVAYVNFLRQ